MGPFIEKLILKKDNYYIETAIDEIDLIRQNSKPEIRAKFELPFNGHLWLAIILKFHEKAHKIVFIILGVLSIKSAASGLSIKIS